MTNQEAFDGVVRHRRVQPEQALIGPACAYRTPEGKKCAIGALMPDEVVAALPLGSNQTGIGCLGGVPAVQALFSGVSLGLLLQLQRVHDGGETAWAHPEAALRLLAQEYELSTSVLDAIEAEGGFPQCS